MSGYTLKDKEKNGRISVNQKPGNYWKPLNASTFKVNGKSTFKEEFVTAGGVV
ncbi:MAG: hypothetical protein R2784_03420 [Saprospiraceae bacterium]